MRLFLLLLPALAACADNLPVAESSQGLASYASSISGFAPISWWRLNDTNTSALDSRGFLNGTYVPTVSLGVFGAIAEDSNKAAQMSSGGYMAISDRKEYSLAIDDDNFDRVVSNGWGALRSGEVWAPQVGSTLALSVGNGTAQIRQSTAGTWQTGTNAVERDTDMQIKVAWGARAQGGTLSPVSLLARRQDNYNYYRAILQETTRMSSCCRS